MTTIIPGISAKGVRELERDVSLVLPYADCIHINLNDDMLASSNGVGMFTFVKKPGQTQFEAHCQTQKPELYVKNLSSLGFTRIIAPVECNDPREFLSEARVFDSEIGLSIDVETPLEEIEPYLEELDFVLIMTAGASGLGQPFEESTLAKIKAIHRNLPDFPIEVEGGINEESIKLVTEAGATNIVATSYIFKDEQNIGSSIEQLQSITAH